MPGQQGQLTTDSGNDLFPAWSPDGTKIVIVSDRTGMPQVWLMDADGTHPRQLTPDPAPKDQLPDGSPDGSKIAYQNYATGNGDIHVMNADGTGQTRLTTDPATELGAAWSPTAPRSRSSASVTCPPPATSTSSTPTAATHTPCTRGFQYVPAWQPLPVDEPG